MNEALRRLLVVLPLAHARPGILVSEIAATLGCDADELRRDLGVLSKVGAPPFAPDDLIDVSLVNDSVFVTIPQGFSRPTRLTATEAAALVAAARSLAPHDGTVKRAAEKLTQAIAPAQRALFDALLTRFLAAPAEPLSQIARVVEGAIAERREVELLYYSPADLAARPRQVRPRAIGSVNGMTYVSAQNAQGGERLYRLDRIASAKLLDGKFAPLPAIDLKDALDRVARLESRTDLARATLHFAPALAGEACARHADARLLEDGSAEVHVAYASVRWLVSYALSWGGRVKVVAPDEARVAFAEAIRAALDAHAS